ncbi:MAG: glycine zipper 2TM domain-containing protein [Pseudomonadota bacterium]
MKRMIIAALSTLCLVSVAQAGDRHHHGHGHHHGHHKHERYGWVIDVEPIYERHHYRRPYRECRSETVTYGGGRDRSHAEGLIVGGLVGGMLGNELGHGQDNAVIAGTILGAAIGHDIDKNNGGGRQSRVVEHCEDRYEHRRHERISGYDVTYRYRGDIYHTRMDHHPGDRIRIDRGRHGDSD